ncbi:MAG: DUF4331 domain-containing protein [Solirubrobacteraceae bacterium]
MSSHREAPATSQDPVADNTDTYAFVSPDDPETVTLIANFLPFEAPFGGPNFFEFGEDVEYYIYVDQTGDGWPDITYTFSFHTEVGNPNTFLYNTGTIDSIDSPNWNRKQFYSVTRTSGGRSEVLAKHLACPPCNIGPASTPGYAALAEQAIHGIGGGRTVFAGQRLEGFYVDLGAIFDLADLRPFQSLHVATMMSNAPGVNSTNEFGVQSIALKVPMSDLTRHGHTPTDPTHRDSVIGVYAAASRQKVRILQPQTGTRYDEGPPVQVSRLGNPLFNEVIVPMGKKDLWNSLSPAQDDQFKQYVKHPELAGLLPSLYPGVFPNLAGLAASRDDLVAILLTGLPAGVVPGFQNYTGPGLADELRLNMAIPPATAAKQNILGVIGGDLAGFPNGRRVSDDVTTIELRAIAGVTYPLVNASYTPDAAASGITDGLTPASTQYLDSFPYLGIPRSGYETAPLSTVA